MFLDEAVITVHGGKGGDGLVGWRREKFVPRGGPAGGDGGKGGSVIFKADPQTDTLSIFAETKVFHATRGDPGGPSRRHGKNGPDLPLMVPPGTIIRDAATKEIIADLAEVGAEVMIARGGRGGYGNAHFASSIRQAPDFAEKGEPGEMRELHLELKMVADAGIVGLPSVGKSTLISVISAAKPKIAEYPFTTLVPNLGVVTIHERSFVVCDVPGLIAGASEGKGLGDKFLRHIERCGIVIHLLDCYREDLVQDYRTIRKELEAYSPLLAKKRELVVLNKIDLVPEKKDAIIEHLRENDIEVFAAISSGTKEGITPFLNALLLIILEERSQRIRELEEEIKKTIPVLRPGRESDRTDAFTIEKKEEDHFCVHGHRIIQITQMTDWTNTSGIQRFRDIVERIGLRKALERLGANESSTVFIGGTDVSGQW